MRRKKRRSEKDRRSCRGSGPKGEPSPTRYKGQMTTHPCEPKQQSRHVLIESFGFRNRRRRLPWRFLPLARSCCYPWRKARRSAAW